MGARQRPLPPAGTVAAVPVGQYSAFPASPLQRIGWALNAPIKSASAKTVLVILAYHANAKGRAWPAVDTVAREGSLSYRATAGAARRLQEAGWLTVFDRRPRTSIYLPKRPEDQHCRECWATLPRAATLCAVCGAETNRQHLPLNRQHLPIQLSTKEDPIKIPYREESPTVDRRESYD